MSRLERRLLVLPIHLHFLSLKWPVTSLEARATCLFSFSLSFARLDSFLCGLCNAGLSVASPSGLFSLLHHGHLPPSRLRVGWCFPSMPLCRAPPLPTSSQHVYGKWQPQPWPGPCICTVTFPHQCHLQLSKSLDSLPVLLDCPLLPWFLFSLLPISFFYHLI